MSALSSWYQSAGLLRVMSTFSSLYQSLIWTPQVRLLYVNGNHYDLLL